MAPAANFLHVILGVFLATHGIRSVARSTLCGVKGDSVEPRIIGGTNASECEWVWQVSVQTAAGTHMCGGVLLSEEWVLTTAHCLSPRVQQVLVGAHNLASPSGLEQRSEIAEKISHPGYNPAIDRTLFDIALIRLQTPVKMEEGDCVSPVCLPDADEKIEVGAECYIAGWGATGGDKTSIELPKTLQELGLRIVDHDACMEDWACSPKKRAHIFLPATALCARPLPGELAAACFGDSGSPLVCKRGGSWKVFGVLSFGDSDDEGHLCSSRRLPQAFADVHLFHEFVTATMSGLNFSPPPVPEEFEEFVPQTCCPAYCPRSCQKKGFVWSIRKWINCRGVCKSAPACTGAVVG